MDPADVEILQDPDEQPIQLGAGSFGSVSPPAKACKAPVTWPCLPPPNRRSPRDTSDSSAGAQKIDSTWVIARCCLLPHPLSALTGVDFIRTRLPVACWQGILRLQSAIRFQGFRV